MNNENSVNEKNSFNAWRATSSENYGSFFFYSATAPKELLTAEEEKALSMIILEAKDEEAVADAKNELIIHNVRLVLKCAKDYFNKGVGGTLSLDDLAQAGMPGLMKAVDKFDYRRGNKFSTMATWWIKQSIRRAIEDEGNQVRLPVYMQELHNKFVKISAEILSKTGREPTDEEMADILYAETDQELQFFQKTGREPTKAEIKKLHKDLFDKVVEIKMYHGRYANMTSLDKVVGEDGETPLIEFIADARRSENSVEDETLQKYFSEKFMEDVRSILPEREFEVIALRFGLKNGREYTLDEVGRMMDPPITRERVRQLESKALLALRKHPKMRKHAQPDRVENLFFTDLGSYFSRIWNRSAGTLRMKEHLDAMIESLIYLLEQNTSYRKDDFVYNLDALSNAEKPIARERLKDYYDLKKLYATCRKILELRRGERLDR